jgi:hypothetical protein
MNESQLMFRQYSNIAFDIFVSFWLANTKVLKQKFGRKGIYVLSESTLGSTLLARFDECGPALVLPVAFWAAAC